MSTNSSSNCWKAKLTESLGGEQMPMNEYGTPLDSNGYAPSLFPSNGCWRCGAFPVERHELYGAALRNKSKALGLWMNLCPACHRTSPEAAHQSKDFADHLKRMGQRAAMFEYGWDLAEWMKRFYKNWEE